MRKQLGLAVLGVLLAMGGGSTTAATTRFARPQDRDVVPGVRIGKIRLGMNRSQVHRIVGRPETSEVISRGVRRDTWYEALPRQIPRAPYSLDVYFRDGKAVQIAVDSPRFRTVGGISAQSDFRQIWKAFPGLEVRQYRYEGAGQPRPLDSLYYDDLRQGIGFLIWVGTPNPERIGPGEQPDELMIHHPGEPALLVRGGARKVNPTGDGTRHVLRTGRKPARVRFGPRAAR